jgi:hypothetical protein
VLAHINIPGLLFIDIETVPQFSAFEQLSDAMKALWTDKHSFLRTENETAEVGYLKRAGVYAEFAKIVCISLGYFHFDRQSRKRTFRLKSFYNDDEQVLLNEFLQLINAHFNDPETYNFCGHNIREFDIPFICRRMLVHRMMFPHMLDVSGRRPWENSYVDTLQLWKFGDYKHYTSLKLLTEILGIPTPKDLMDGKDVSRVYWQEKGLAQIAEYCQKDVVTVARLLLRFKGDPELLNDSDVIIIK